MEIATNSSSFTIKQWSEDDRPREKLLQRGRQNVSDAELIAILIGSGNKEDSAVELSRKMLAAFGNNLNELARQSVNDLCRFNGIGEAKALSIISALELGRRRKDAAFPERIKVTCSRDIFEALRSVFLDLPHEEFHILLLNRQNCIISREFISRGGVSGTVVDPKLIFKPALQNLASGVVLCHNHPSGNLCPSEQDISLTRKIREAGNLLEIPVLDHIIFSDAGYYSFADEGML